MVPIWAIPLVIQLGSKLIDMAFSQTEKLPPEKQSKVLDKIEANEAKALKKKEEPDEDDY